MNRHNEKRLGEEVLQRIKKIDPNAIIAGGAPRDWWMGKECSDIDIYLKAPELSSDPLRQAAISLLGFNRVRSMSAVDEDYEGISDLLAVFEFDYEGKTFNIMFMDEYCAFPYTGHFSCSICEIYYDGQYHPSPKFMKTLLDKVIILSDDVDENTKHVQKIAGKFPGYTFAKFVKVRPSFVEVKVSADLGFDSFERDGKESPDVFNF